MESPEIHFKVNCCFNCCLLRFFFFSFFSSFNFVSFLQNGGAKDGFDMNIGGAWQKGYTGKGIVVSILDDGIQTNHPDLALNYVSGFTNFYTSLLDVWTIYIFLYIWIPSINDISIRPTLIYFSACYFTFYAIVLSFIFYSFRKPCIFIQSFNSSEN